MSRSRRRPSTIAVRAGLESDPTTRAVVPPLHLSSTFAFRGFNDKGPYDYTRSGNPTRDLLSSALTELEGGAGAVVTATGMAAITLVGQLLPTGARIVAPHDCYGGTFRLFQAWRRTGRFAVDFIDYADHTALARALGTACDLVWIETPSNPLLRITDIEQVVALAHGRGARAVVDNTFLSPLWQQPLRLGADLVVHSTTKYLNGHSDVVGGAVVAATRELSDELAWWANCLGLTGAPFDSYLTLRGLRSLSARMQVHEKNAVELAQWLGTRREVLKVYYPGLAKHPGHLVARRQQTGFGAIITIEIANGARGAKALVENLRLFSLAESLGGVESLVAHPATMTHAAMEPEARAAAGLVDGLLRLSVGIEDVEDLRDDLATGLDQIRLG
ncbi:MAG: cystathionine gamma-synthase [Steroidobacteraceae bacterium]